MNKIGRTVELQEIRKIYETRSGQYTAVSNINFAAERGKLTLLLGPSGSGKTTLLTLMAGFVKPTAGEVILFGKNIKEYTPAELQRMRMQRIGFVFQTFLLIDSLSVFENVALVNSFLNVNRKYTRDAVYNALEKVGISHLHKKLPPELSHGERQRTAIARAFVNSTELLIADEPTASIEAEQGENIIQLLHSFTKDKQACVIIASHDLRLKNKADDCYLIENGTMRSYPEKNILEMK